MNMPTSRINESDIVSKHSMVFIENIKCFYVIWKINSLFDNTLTKTVISYIDLPNVAVPVIYSSFIVLWFSTKFCICNKNLNVCYAHKQNL